MLLARFLPDAVEPHIGNWHEYKSGASYQITKLLQDGRPSQRVYMAR